MHGQFCSVACLAKTARIFYNVWRNDPSSIRQAVDTRVIANFADAERLVDMQEHADIVGESELPDWRERRPINRAKRLIANARRASIASTEWEVSFKRIMGQSPSWRADCRRIEPGIPLSQPATEDLHYGIP
ncbi:hypothetical protein BT63DRAFT_443872 [Microthyrium microscopicum]|uniref:Uncharacterized protein n=1 Tax=Microthyrium microscopicum TaxID=703497 RepID=A0A6A6TW68_9PEZI|nr:hypothetical protein BT63DRAFT_443872 [Microthyrium microscopicum]